MIKKLRIVLRYWFLAFPKGIISETWLFFGKTRTALFIAGVSLLIGSVLFLAIYGFDSEGQRKVIDIITKYTAYTLAPAIIFTVLVLLWNAFYLPAELHNRLLKKNGTEYFLNQAMKLSRNGSQLKTNFIESDWSDKETNKHEDFENLGSRWPCHMGTDDRI